MRRPQEPSGIGHAIFPTKLREPDSL